MFPVKDIMSQDVITVSRDTGIYDAIGTMVDSNITGLPVVDADGTLVGILTEKDVLRLLCNVEDHAGTVEDFMTRKVVTFNEDETLVEIADCFMRHSFRRVPIVRDGRIVGVISRRDIVRFILSLRHAK